MPLTPPPLFPEKNSGSVHGHHYELHVDGEEIVHVHQFMLIKYIVFTILIQILTDM